MIQTELLFCIFKLIIGGLIAFLAILLWSKTRESSWMCLVAAAVTGYASIVCDLLLKLGVIKNETVEIYGNVIPIFRYITLFVPGLFIIIAFILMLVQSNKKE